jgi:uncharacterized protein YijF (DUF1287 family)
LLFSGFSSCETLDDASQGEQIAQAARSRIGVTTRYVPDYVTMDYPGGDVPEETGVCTDVVIRALREVGIDLQKEVHEDMKAHFSKYPEIWGLKRTDRSIDHRRVPNLRTYFKRKDYSLPVTKKPADYRAGDLVTCTVVGKLPHVMVVSDRKGQGGRPLVIHNIGRGTQEEDRLFDFPITGHYRIAKSTGEDG